MHFSLVFFLWFFPLWNLYSLPEYFSSVLPVLSTAYLFPCYSLCFSLCLCLYFHFHLRDVRQGKTGPGMSFSYLSSPSSAPSLRLLRLCRRLFSPFARLGSWLWLFLVRVICFAYYSRLARLDSTRPLLAYALCYFCGLALVTCKFLLPFVFAFVLFPSSNNQKPQPAARRHRTQSYVPPETQNQMRAMIVVVLVRLVVCAGMWPDPAVGPSRCPLVRKALWFCPSTLDCLALKGLECLKWTCGIFQSVHSRRMCVKYPQCEVLPFPVPFPF